MSKIKSWSQSTWNPKVIYSASQIRREAPGKPWKSKEVENE